ncbi:hypothetical protein EJB05_08173, partial [Eragrostis curvula]
METVHVNKSVKPANEENSEAKDRSVIGEFQHSPSGDLDLSNPQVVKEEHHDQRG